MEKRWLKVTLLLEGNFVIVWHIHEPFPQKWEGWNYMTLHMKWFILANILSEIYKDKTSFKNGFWTTYM